MPKKEKPTPLFHFCRGVVRSELHGLLRGHTGIAVYSIAAKRCTFIADLQHGNFEETTHMIFNGKEIHFCPNAVNDPANAKFFRSWTKTLKVPIEEVWQD